MNKHYLKGLCSLLFLAFAIGSGQAQAFHRGSFLVNLSEGWTQSDYSTHAMEPGHPELKANQAHMEGVRDPLTIEYGLSNHWGIGSSWGTDFFYLNPSAFYGFHAPSDKVKATTSEYTINGNYHFYTSKRTDLVLVASLGTLSVSMKGTDGETPFQYNASGAIVRLGAHARYYFYRHFGVLGMLSLYTSSCSPAGVKGNSLQNSYSTGISGFAAEYGFCYRIGK